MGKASPLAQFNARAPAQGLLLQPSHSPFTRQAPVIKMSPASACNNHCNSSTPPADNATSADANRNGPSTPFHQASPIPSGSAMADYFSGRPTSSRQFSFTPDPDPTTASESWTRPSSLKSNSSYVCFHNSDHLYVPDVLTLQWHSFNCAPVDGPFDRLSPSPKAWIYAQQARHQVRKVVRTIGQTNNQTEHNNNIWGTTSPGVLHHRYPEEFRNDERLGLESGDHLRASIPLVPGSGYWKGGKPDCWRATVTQNENSDLDSMNVIYHDPNKPPPPGRTQHPFSEANYHSASKPQI